MGPRLSAPLTFQPQASVGSRSVSPQNRRRTHARSASSNQTAKRPPRRCRWATHKPWRLHGRPVTSTLRATRREKRSKPSTPKRRPKRRKSPSHHNSCRKPTRSGGRRVLVTKFCWHPAPVSDQPSSSIWLSEMSFWPPAASNFWKREMRRRVRQRPDWAVATCAELKPRDDAHARTNASSEQIEP